MLSSRGTMGEGTAEGSPWRGVWPRLGVSLALGALFAWLAARGGVPLIPRAAAFDGVAAWAVPGYVATLLVTHTLRATRWRYLIAPVARLPLRDVLILNFIGFFAILVLPLRIGEVARPALTKLRHGISMSVGFGTVAVERVVDGLITSLCVAWALFALPRMQTDNDVANHLPGYGYAALVLFTGAFLALGLFLWQRSLAVTLTRRVVGLVSPDLADFLGEKVGSVADGVRSIGSARLATGFMIESLLYWGSNALGVWLLGVGCGLPMTPGHAVAIMGVLAIGILLPTGPGLFGNFQLAVSAALHLYFAAPLIGSAGAVFIFWLYVLQSAVMVLAGVVPLYATRLKLGDLLSVRG